MNYSHIVFLPNLLSHIDYGNWNIIKKPSCLVYAMNLQELAVSPTFTAGNWQLFIQFTGFQLNVDIA